MIGFYYRVWVDCIKRLRAQPTNRHDWRAKSMFAMTFAMAFGLVFIMTILDKLAFKTTFYKLNFTFLPDIVDNVLEYIFLFIFPCALINHLLIFRKQRYKKLLEKYPYYNGKLFIAFLITSLMVPLVALWVVLLSKWL